MMTTESTSATTRKSLNMVMPLGACNPLIQSGLRIFPERVSNEIDPLPSLSQGPFPSILVTYKRWFLLSSSTDSGTFRVVSVAHNLLRLWAIAPDAIPTTIKNNNIDFFICLIYFLSFYIECTDVNTCLEPANNLLHQLPCCRCKREAKHGMATCHDDVIIC